MSIVNVLAAIHPVWTWILGVTLVVLAVFLAVIIAKQTGKEEGLSGTIVGNSETYFGKNRGGNKDAILSKLTIIGSVLLVILVFVLVIIVKNTNFSA